MNSEDVKQTSEIINKLIEFDEQHNKTLKEEVQKDKTYNIKSRYF
jgi:hypothetical protein